jgi:hypothetical protein
MTDSRLQREIDWRQSIGQARLSVAELGRRYAALGYQLDRRLDCLSSARYMTGERAGETYPACDTGLKEADTGKSAWHCEARRDDLFKTMQALRGEVFAVTRSGHILEV